MSQAEGARRSVSSQGACDSLSWGSVQVINANFDGLVDATNANVSLGPADDSWQRSTAVNRSAFSSGARGFRSIENAPADHSDMRHDGMRQMRSLEGPPMDISPNSQCSSSQHSLSEDVAAAAPRRHPHSHGRDTQQLCVQGSRYDGWAEVTNAFDGLVGRILFYFEALG